MSILTNNKNFTSATMIERHGSPYSGVPLSLRPTEKELIRFFKKVDKSGDNGCWLWTGWKEDQYGAFSFRGNVRRAHRISYSWFVGPVPARALVLHKCDNPPCVNPEHLFLGSQKDNVHDCLRKNRRAIFFGEEHGMAKLTARQVSIIRDFCAEFEVSPKVLGEWVGVTGAAISAILKRKNWRAS